MTPQPVPLLDTSAGEFKLQEYRLRRGDREWTVLHTGTVLTREDELRVIGQEKNRLPSRSHWVIGSDILYGESLHPDLRRIFENNLAPGGRVLLSDPFRATSFRLLETMESDGWTVSFNKWEVGEEGTPRPIGVFELVPPKKAN